MENAEEAKSSTAVTSRKDDEDSGHDVKLSQLYNLERPKDVVSGVADVSFVSSTTRITFTLYSIRAPEMY